MIGSTPGPSSLAMSCFRLFLPADRPAYIVDAVHFPYLHILLKSIQVTVLTTLLPNESDLQRNVQAVLPCLQLERPFQRVPISHDPPTSRRLQYEALGRKSLTSPQTPTPSRISSYDRVLPPFDAHQRLPSPEATHCVATLLIGQRMVKLQELAVDSEVE